MLLKRALEVRATDRPQGPCRKPTWGERLMVKNSIQNVFKTKSFTKQGTRGEHTSAYGIRIVSAFGLWLTHSIRYPNRITGWISGPSRDHCTARR